MGKKKVSKQVTDAVTQTNVQVVASAPQMAMANIYQAMAHSMGIMFTNSALAQQRQNSLALAATAQGVSQIYSLNTTSTAIAIATILKAGR